MKLFHSGDNFLKSILRNKIFVLAVGKLLIEETLLHENRLRQYKILVKTWQPKTYREQMQNNTSNCNAQS